MLIIISPSKTLNFEAKPVIPDFTLPEFRDESQILVKKLRTMKPKKLAELMDLSFSLAELNYQRYQAWHLPFTPGNAKQAVLAFSGDVYAGLEAPSLSRDKLLSMQKKLRILSGLYGVLKPLDLIQPYRLEMGTGLKTGRYKDLYAFWSKKITSHIQQAINDSGGRFLINLASAEYSKSVLLNKLNAEIITPSFKEMKNGEYKIISVFAKKARGMMTRFIIDNDIIDPEELQAFDSGGYHFNPRLSKQGLPVFTRG